MKGGVDTPLLSYKIIKMNCKYILCLLSVCLTSYLVSCTTDDDPKPDPGKDENVNAWIYDIMEKNYLWYDELPEKESLDFHTTPDKFFHLLLSENDGKVLNGETEHHYFSTIEKKKSSTKSINADSSYGFEFAVAEMGNTGKYAAWIIYVLPNSPASEVGLKRGDWIVGVNSQNPNITDYSVLRSGSAVTFLLATFDNTRKVWVGNGTVDIAASRPVEDTPFLLDSVYTYGSKRIGYLVYNHFTTGPDGYEDQSYNNRMKQIFADFKTKNVNEFILDLRNNGGGVVTSAQLLSSLLAPGSALGKEFCHMKYNDRNEKKNSSLKFQTDIAGTNLDLSSLYVLVSDRTASSSELVINSLIPYLGRANIILIGEQTVGKTVGSVEYGANEAYDWLISPIVMRVYNANDEADYDDGFVPDILVKELVVGKTLYPLGDSREELLSVALNRITGATLKSSSAPGEKMEIIYNSLDDKKTNGVMQF